MFHPANAAAPRRAPALPFPAPLLGMEGSSTRYVSVKLTGSVGKSECLGTPGVGSFPCASEAGNSRLIRCVVSGVGSY